MLKIAIIPARGGSKRIPRKNIRNFLGKPIIEYSIKTALESGIYDVVMVSTDDVEIADLAKKCGAEVPFYRSSDTSDDNATTAAVLLEVLEKYEGQGKFFDIGTCIYPTAPFITEKVLKESFTLLESGKYDTIFPVVRYSYPIQRALKVENNKMKLFSEQYKKSRSQDLEPSFHDAGQFYTFKVKEFKELENLWTENTGVIEMPELEVQDIDNEEDWKIAELKFNLIDRD